MEQRKTLKRRNKTKEVRIHEALLGEKAMSISILVIGDAILDKYIYGVINRQSPEDLSIPVVDVEKEETKRKKSESIH